MISVRQAAIGAGIYRDPGAEFLYVPTKEVLAAAKERDATPYDIPDVHFSHEGERCSFDAFLRKYRLTDPALARLADIAQAGGLLAGALLELAWRSSDSRCGSLPFRLAAYSSTLPEVRSRVYVVRDPSGEGTTASAS